MFSAYRVLLAAVCLAAAVANLRPLAAEDVFYRVPLADLKLTEGELPEDADDFHYNWRVWDTREAMRPRVVIDGKGEAYVGLPSRNQRWSAPSVLRSEGAVVVRAPERREVTGSLYLPNNDYSGMVKLRFAIPQSAAVKESDPFYRAKLAHFDALLERGIAGSAWFRHERRAADSALGNRERPAEETGVRARRRTADIDDTFALFSGGRAIRENLQLDRDLRLADKKNEETVDVASLKGITIAEIDWKPLLGDAEPKLDPLAAAIPADQHAVFSR